MIKPPGEYDEECDFSPDFEDAVYYDTQNQSNLALFGHNNTKAKTQKD